MSKIEFAFPREEYQQPTDRGQTGMTLRDYFAAHAPKEPQPWFRPVTPERPERPLLPVYGGPWTRGMVERAAQWLNDDAGADLIGFMPHALTDEQRGAVEAFAKEIRQADAARAEWRAERAKQTYVQWPYAWADEQLKIR